ncbi:52 kDa repressor of the inhibitor of the protein kinase-like [Hydractinia symbiolongicarpus]|uniref:52 kDa repressor of the inhibitor of the protein kinase-like n=1 Tax=Hydractinia symbiolongicarpus TaxID=13093 RepID=UPI00254F22D6|nr:52 kDa repressor of the inhibitor of the protein kinase-like [Hydractinia symbiolongicarpus]
MSKIKEISYFFNFSQKRQQLLEKNVIQYCPNSDKSKLKDVCRTRWIERIDGMEVFQELYVAIYVTLDDMFIVSVVVTRNVLALTHGVTTLLQDKSIDITDNVQYITNLKNTTMSCRNNVDFFHNSWYKEALDVAESVGVEEKMKRVIRRQTLRDNQPAISPKDYYKKALTIPILDHLNSELNSRFDFENFVVYNGLCIVPAKVVSMVYSNKDWKSKFKRFVDFYKSDMPNPLALESELELWEKFALDYQGTRPETIAQTLKSINLSLFTNINVAIRILATIPITSCECERSFSSLRRLKDYCRSTMTEDRLNGLSLMYIHEEIIPKIQFVHGFLHYVMCKKEERRKKIFMGY